jgi:glycosyltransferase involved in cell wall biosynthesis
MMVVHNEADRYLGASVRSLLEFCDNVRILDDGSDDAPLDLFLKVPEVQYLRQETSSFYTHEGNTRQALLEWAMEANPTHILAIDADEFVADGQALRTAMEEGCATGVWKLSMEEVWKAEDDFLSIRWDGLWKPRPCGIAFAVPEDHHTNRQNRRHWRLPDRALACGRVPVLTQMAGNRTISEPVCPIFHFGWACEADRDARYQRYVEHDSGRHHDPKHLESIMWGDDQVELRHAPWWPALDKTALLARVNRC